MEIQILISILAVLLLVTIYSLMRSFFSERVTMQARVKQAAVPRAIKKKKENRLSNWLRPVGRLLPRSKENFRQEQQKLVVAGLRGPDAIYVFYGIRVAVGLASLFALGVLGMPSNNLALYILLPVLLAAMLPDLGLAWVTRRRQHRIQLGLPDMTDLTVICVEAGMGLDQAISRIAGEIRDAHQELSDELRLYNLEVQAGQRRTEALRNLSARTGVSDLKALAVTLIQADRFGTSIARTMRIFSETLRTKRRQRAEEQAAKMGVKMLFPLLLFIFPAVFIVVAGPAVIQIVRHLLPTLGGN